jgi:hypothetical protein
MPEPTVKYAIQYEPHARGLCLALAYVRLPRRRGSGTYDLYGYYCGYSGRGAYRDEFFHVTERRHRGFVSFTTPNRPWTEWVHDRVGVSGLVGRRWTPELERLLWKPKLGLERRWFEWNDNTGVPDLKQAAKLRLGCSARKVFYASRGFKLGLLPFLSQQWELSVAFAPAVVA